MCSSDLLSRKAYVCGGSAQVPQSRPGIHGLNLQGIHSACDSTGIPGGACNPKFVYDASDYIRFKRLNAINNSYNDTTFGGDDNNAGQSALNFVR